MPPILWRDRPITRKEVRGFLAQSFLVLRRKLCFPFFCESRDSYSLYDFLAMLGTPPQMDPAVEVIGLADEPPAVEFVDFQQEWKNRLYKVKYWIGRELMEMDQTGQVWTLLHSTAARLANFPDKLFFHRLVNGTATTWGAAYDGQAFFATSHTLGAGAPTPISNLLSGTLFAGGAWSLTNRDALAQRTINDLSNAIAMMKGFKDDRGEPFHLNSIDPKKLVVLCGPLMEPIFRYITDAENIAMTTNVMKGSVGAVVDSNYLPAIPTDPEAFDWYLAYTSERNRPWVYSRFRRRTDKEIQDSLSLSEVKKVEGFGDTSMDDLRELSSVLLETNLGNQGNRAEADVIRHERFVISGRWRGEILPGEWRNMVKVNNAASL